MRAANVYPRSAPALDLGRVHWYLSAASQTLQKKAEDSVVRQTGGSIKIYSRPKTPFGREVGNDEIRWWVSKCEQNLQELESETQRLIPSLQKIIDTIANFSFGTITGYQSLIKSLEKLTDVVAEEIKAVLRYVLLLKDRDALAPSMLLTTKVWAATPLGRRRINVTSHEFDAEPEDNQQYIIECVYGLRVGGVINHQRLESLRITDNEGGTPEQSNALAVTVDVQHEMLYYFRSLRGCLNNILIEIQAVNDLESIVHSSDFWSEFVKQAALSNTVEPELWDFKQTLDYWRVPSKENESAKFKFATDVASFANNNGGALIVGVTDGPPRRIVGIPHFGKDLENKLKTIPQVLGEYLGHNQKIYEIRQVDIDGQTCIIIAIAQTRDVVKVRHQTGYYVYPLRSIAESKLAKPEDIQSKKKDIVRDNYQFIQDLRNRVVWTN